jgi:hypothetical protein
VDARPVVVIHYSFPRIRSVLRHVWRLHVLWQQTLRELEPLQQVPFVRLIFPTLCDLVAKAVRPE